MSRPLALAGIVVSLAFLPALLDQTLSSRFTLLALLLALGCLIALLSKETGSLKVDAVAATYFFFVMWNCLSVTWSLNKAEAFFSAGRVVLGFGVFVATLIMSTGMQRELFRTLFIANLLLAFILSGVSIWQIHQLADLSKDSLYAVTGLQGHKNLLSSFLFLNLCFVVITLPGHSRWGRWVGWTAILLVAVLIVILRTRAVWLGLLATPACFVFFHLLTRRPARKPHLLFWLVLVMVLANVFWLWLFPMLVEAAGSGHASLVPSALADRERLQLWERSIDLFRKHPFAGVGAGNWQIFFPDMGLGGIWRAEELNFTFQRPHNDFLWILTETGIVGFNAFVLVIALIGCKAIVFLRANLPPGSWRTLAALSFLCGFLLISVFDFPRERLEHVLWSNVLLAVIHSSVYGQEKKSLLPAFSGRRFYLVGSIVLVLLVVTGALRMKGEYYTRLMYDNRSGLRSAEVIRYARAAENTFYDLDPTSMPLTWYSGNARADLGDVAGALRDLEKAYALNPYNRNVLNDLGSAYVLSENTEKAKSLYAEAARISPRFDEAKLNLVAVLIGEKNFPEAAWWLDSLLHDSERRRQYRAIVDMELQNGAEVR